ncbi:MAG: peptidoglycan DD-metalloendopeptidase family protein [Candidatus Peribacteraceae bacterium]|nr:peptidoglycan DD-metalloendopeptidase family protein [Candidatus Peribacteraceae bacterium]
MHTHKRFLVLTLLCAVLAPLAGSATLLSSVSLSGNEEFNELLSLADASYRKRSAVGKAEDAARAAVEEASAKVTALSREKRAVRLRLAEVRKQCADMRSQVLVMEREHERLARLDDRPAGADMRTAAPSFLRIAWLGPEAEMFAPLPRESLLVQQRETTGDFLGRLRTWADAAEQEALALAAQREELLAAYHAADRELDAANASLRSSEARDREIRRQIAQVHGDVLRLQAELERIDARIRRKAERELLEKGLLTPEEAQERSKRTTGTAQFVWPAQGPVTAWFHDRSYQSKFGVPHEAIDIARPQGSPVASAAEGVVFLVRDGGATGYTYVLIGHRGGYATLYGHLSSVFVVAGQDVQAGQVIGRSGGQPGTPGAGYLTTGAHVHFEVIRQGSNIDPLTVLPKR